MGLDMFLFKKTEEMTDRNLVEDQKIFSNETEICYWRKVNSLHRYFCENGREIQKGIIYEISYETIRELYITTAQVVAWQEKAPELLPTQEGFFFGCTAYDECYFWDIQRAHKTMEEIVTKYTVDDKFIYYASW